MNNKKSNFTARVIFVVLAISVSFLLTACGDVVAPEDELSPESTPEVENCLSLRAGTVNVELVHPDFLIPAWHLIPGSSERSNSRMELWSKIESGSYEKSKKKIVLIVTDSYLQTVEDIVRLSKIDPGLEYEESTFNDFPAAYSQMVNETEGVWNYYMIPFGNRTIELSYHQSILTPDEQAQVGEMLKGIILSQSTEDIERSDLEECS